MKLSLGSWAFSFGPYAANPVSFEAVVRRLSAAGFDGIDVSGFPPHVTLEKYPSRPSRLELVRFLEDHSLGVSGYSADFSEVNPIITENERRYLDLLRRNVQMAVDIGSPSLRIDSVTAPGSLPDDEYDRAFHRLARIWAEGAEIAQNAGVRLVWEFEPGFVFNKPEEIVRMHQEVRHPNFSIVFDTSHAYMCGVVGARQHGKRDVLQGGVSEFLDKLQGRIGAIHLIDSDGTLHHDETSTHRPFGEGLIDFERLAPKLLAVPNIEWWTIDMCFWAGSWELVEASRKFVAGLLARHTVAV
ncbi:MAG: sugar phosphate isomerase/epimerase family protein [Bryobacteraceae bacterium]|jgi:sugar phosphate isomerase/epimerase